MIAEIQWDKLFGLSIPALELIIRGTAVYWFLFLLFRFVLRREIGSIGLTDVLFVVVVADAAQNGMAGEYKSITDGFILIATIAAWNVLVDWLNMKFPSVRNVLEARLLMLVSNGRVGHRVPRYLTTVCCWAFPVPKRWPHSSFRIGFEPYDATGVRSICQATAALVMSISYQSVSNY